MNVDELIRHMATHSTGQDSHDDETVLARFTTAAQRTDADPDETARIDNLAEVVDAEIAAYDHGLAALDHGDAETAQAFLLQAIPTGAETTTALVTRLLSRSPHAAIEPDLQQAAADLRAERLIVNATYRRHLSTRADRQQSSVAPSAVSAVSQTRIDDLVGILLAAMEAKDPITLRHSQHIGWLTALIGQQIGLPDEYLAAAHLGGLLHDIGKLAVPTEVLCKTGPLTEAEFKLIQAHVTHGVSIVDQVSHLACGNREASAANILLDHALDGIRYHHERFDGRGYLHGLAGHDIPQIARLIAVADAFDAMTTTRHYRPAWPVDKAVAELRRHAGSVFDPVMVEAFLTVINEHGERIEHLIHLARGERIDPAEHEEQKMNAPTDMLRIIERR